MILGVRRVSVVILAVIGRQMEAPAARRASTPSRKLQLTKRVRAVKS
jgi:hypothetical protein